MEEINKNGIDINEADSIDTNTVNNVDSNEISSDGSSPVNSGEATETAKADLIAADPNFVIIDKDSTSYKTVDENDEFELIKEHRTRRKLPEGEAHEANTGRKHKHSSSDGTSGYITKRFFTVTLIIAIVLTAVLSTAASVYIIRNTSDSAGSYSNLTNSGIDSSSGSKLSTQEIASKNIDAVVEISTASVSTNMFGQQQISEGAGSGVIVNKDGYIVTNNHVISGAKKITVTLHNGKSYNGKLVGTDPENDVAVVKISASNLTVATIGDSSKLVLGDQTVVIGNPLGSLGGTVTTGIISALERRLTLDNDTTLDLLQTDAAINPGNSGGGLFNGAGELVGIVVAKSSGTGIEGLGFAIPINSVGDIIDSLIDDGKLPEKGYIGISIRDIDSDYASYYQLDGAGIYVVDVTSESARKAGFEVGDKLISINGEKPDSKSDFIARVHEYKIGDTVTVVIERDGVQKTIKAKLVGQNSSQLKSDSQELEQDGMNGMDEQDNPF